MARPWFCFLIPLLLRQYPYLKQQGLNKPRLFGTQANGEYEQRRQSFLTHTNLKIAPSLLVIFVP